MGINFLGISIHNQIENIICRNIIGFLKGDRFLLQRKIPENRGHAFCLAVLYWGLLLITLQWLHNGRDGVSNHQRHDCLLIR